MWWVREVSRAKGWRGYRRTSTREGQYTRHDLLIAKATQAGSLPERLVGLLSTATDAGMLASRAGARALWLTHLWPGSDAAVHLAAAAAAFAGPVAVAVPHPTWDAEV